MVVAKDFLNLPYTPDLTEAGIAYASQVILKTYDQQIIGQIKNLQKIVAEIATELAIRRHLVAQEVPHDIINVTHFSNPDKYDIVLGGRRCELKTCLIYQKNQIRKVRVKPEILLEDHAFVSKDEIYSENYVDEDIYIFAYLNGRVTNSYNEIAIAVNAKHPIALLHTLPDRWSHPFQWRSLGKIVMKTNLDFPLQVEIGGLNSARNFQIVQTSLDPRIRTPLKQEFHSVNYMITPFLLSEMIGIYSPVLNETYLIKNSQWENVWVYGLEVLVVGYMTRGEFRRKAVRYLVKDTEICFPQNRDNIALPVSMLHPVNDLFIRARNWSQHR